MLIPNVTTAGFQTSPMAAVESADPPFRPMANSK
jgi:hypothetical protein